MINNRILAGGLALGFGLATVSPASDVNKDAVVGAKVKLNACVASDKDDSFVLTHVEEIEGPKSTVSTPTPMAMSGMKDGGPSEVIYWLSADSVKRMRGLLGNKVEVTGTITDVSMGTLRVQQDPGKPGTGNDNTIKVEARNKDAEATTDRPVVAGADPVAKSDTKQALPVRRVKVKDVRVLAKTCP